MVAEMGSLFRIRKRFCVLQDVCVSYVPVACSPIQRVWHRYEAGGMRPPQPDLHLRRHCRRFAGGTTPTATGWQRQQERLLAPGRLLRPAPHWLLRVTWRAAAATPWSVGLPSLDLTL